MKCIQHLDHLCVLLLCTVVQSSSGVSRSSLYFPPKPANLLHDIFRQAPFSAICIPPRFSGNGRLVGTHFWYAPPHPSHSYSRPIGRFTHRHSKGTAGGFRRLWRKDLHTQQPFWPTTTTPKNLALVYSDRSAWPQTATTPPL